MASSSSGPAELHPGADAPDVAEVPGKLMFGSYVLGPLALEPSGSRCSKKQYLEIAEDTVKEIQQGWYTNEESERVDLAVEAAVAFTRLLPAASAMSSLAGAPKDRRGPCVLSVAHASTLQVAEALVQQGSRTCVLNFASAKNPGGGFLRGANAQEESLARASGLYQCLLKPEVQAFYQDNASDPTCVYTDNMIMSPHVPIFKGDDGRVLEAPYSVGMLTVPAPNFGVAITRSGVGAEAIRAARQQRMRRALGALAAEEEFDAVVLGAWGCGVFGNEPVEVALEFQELLCGSYRDSFCRVVFAILDQNMCSAFEQVFNGQVDPSSGPRPASGGKSKHERQDGGRAQASRGSARQEESAKSGASRKAKKRGKQSSVD